MICFWLVLSGCSSQPDVSANVVQTTLPTQTTCSGQFVTRDLAHITGLAIERVGFFISNGSGLAVNDLDNDGDMDLVVGDLLGPNHVFWNEGNWNFRRELLFEGSTRAITTVDVDADGWLDIVLTTRNGDILYWHNLKTGQFEQVRLPDLQAYAYAIDWADLDGDNDLDLVTASYDASLAKQNAAYEESQRAGAFVYINEGGQFSQTRLASEAQALTVHLLDINEDGRIDILVGNDFDVPDYVWLASDDGWQEVHPFATTTMSTMSFASGDVNNDGRSDLFATDMHPYSDAPEIMAQWQPVMDAMHHDMVPGDPQQMTNVLQVRGADGGFENTAVQSGIDATGWSWSTQFGDLNQDGFLDLYVVNGMQALDNFSHLPNDELVEENQAYRNDGQGNFIPELSWVLNSRHGGRSMMMADFDQDGDLDIVVNNLQDLTQFFENQLCEGSSVLVDLRWPDSANTHALGAVLTLHTSTGDYVREVRAASGYLSGNPARVHFGLPADSQIESLKVIWPDGEFTTIADLQSGNLIRIERK